jgi:hypothetical protein
MDLPESTMSRKRREALVMFGSTWLEMADIGSLHSGRDL